MKVFLSSTAEDLNAHRKVGEDVVLQLSQQIVAMEHFSALPGTPVEECERLARESDVVVCIVAHRYGSGITQREVQAAHKAGKDVLVWIVAEDHPWSEKKEENQLADPNVFSDPAKVDEVRQRVEALFNFKAWLRKTFIADKFTTPDDLGRKIAIALANYVKGHAAPLVPQDRISIARLPVTGQELFGREAELQILDDAWANSNINIVSFIAWGGVGKTALVNNWLKRRMARDNYRGAKRVLGWSFFSQGSNERAASADLFIDWALRWFDDADPTFGSPWEKGERLARYIRQTRTLLILDGLEPLQHPPGPHEGRLKDAALQALLVELAAQQPGLCVISTRETVGDLVDFERGTVIQHDLEHLSPQTGAQILRSLNVKGDTEELEEAARELGGHAFSLTLLGSYLEEVFSGDIHRRKEIENVFEDTRFGSAGQKMIAAYEKWLGEGMELAILRLLGLFDRPADLASILALREPPAIIGLTEPLQRFKGREWNQAVAKLRRIKLLAEGSPDEPGRLDAHPLVREHFKQQLIQHSSSAWCEANSRLYEHLKTTAIEFPESVEEMSPLHSAVVHGCCAKKFSEALVEVYQRRIQRGTDHFHWHTLGAYGTDLVVLSGFFQKPWEQTVPELTDREKGFVLNEAGVDLRALGRLQEAVQPTKSALEMTIGLEDWGNASRGASNLTELYITVGELDCALKTAKQGVEFADRSDETFLKAVLRAVLGDVFHLCGDSEKAFQTFREGEAIQQQSFPRFPIFYSWWGFLYCDLLLDAGEVQEVKHRAETSLEYSAEGNWPGIMGLEKVLLGRACLLEAQRANTKDVGNASELMDEAVTLLRTGGRIDRLPYGLLARASLHRYILDFENAARDLVEVHRIATRSGNRLHLADCHLESARFQLAEQNKDKACEHLATAKETIYRIGYHRRDKEVAELEARLA